MSRPQPNFVIMATDPHAPAALDRYADLLESQRAPAGMISKARHVAQKMRDWLAEQKPEVKAEEPAPAVTSIEPAEPEPSDEAPPEGQERSGKVLDGPLKKKAKKS